MDGSMGSVGAFDILCAIITIPLVLMGIGGIVILCTKEKRR